MIKYLYITVLNQYVAISGSTFTFLCKHVFEAGQIQPEILNDYSIVLTSNVPERSVTTVNYHITFVYSLKTMLLCFTNYKLEILQSWWKKNLQ